MSQFYISPEEICEKTVRITGGTSRHLLKSLRIKIGEKIKLFDGLGHAWQALITDFSKEEVYCRLIQEIQHKEPTINLKLYFAVPARKAFEDIIERCTAAGISKFQPIITSRTQENKKDWDERLLRIRQICISSCEQCERTFLPEVLPPISYAEALLSAEASIKEKNACFIATFEGSNIVRALKIQQNVKNIFLFVGPEGGFTQYELQQAISKKLVPVNLGAHVLRAEDACFYASLALINTLSAE